MNNPTYWGIRCKTCLKLVAFDAAPYPSFGPRASNLKPGAICCANGHNHIYFPRDFQFIASEASIPDAVMEQNRVAYAAINPYSPLGTGRTPPPETKPTDVLPARQRGSRERSAPDPRRQAAQIAAKSRWAEWALKKVL